MIVGFSTISLNILNAQSTSKSEIAKHLIIPLKKGDEAKIKAIQDTKISSETFSVNAELSNLYFQQLPGGIPVHNAILNAHVIRTIALFSHQCKLLDLPFEKTDPVIIPAITKTQAMAAVAAYFKRDTHLI
jgi:hypothetical protein